MDRLQIVFASSLVVLLGAQAGCSHKPEARKHTSPIAELAPPSEPKAADKSDGKEVAGGDLEKVIYFDFDSRTLREDARPVLAKIAEVAKKTNATVRIEGNTDERGTTEYNMALGEERARAAKTYLEQMGVPKHKLQIVSYGSERPKVEGHDESSWAKNRRDEIVLK